MSLHAASPAVVRFPPRLRVVPGPANDALAASGIAPGKRGRDSHLHPLTSPKTVGGLALDTLLSAGTIDARQHAAGLAYAALRLRHDTAKHGGGGLPPERWAAVKRDHAALLAAAGFDRFLLDRLCLDGEAPLRCEVGRVRAALGRVVDVVGAPTA